MNDSSANRFIKWLEGAFIGICLATLIFIFKMPHGAITFYSSVYAITIFSVILWDKIASRNSGNKFNAEDLNTNDIFLKRFYLYFTKPKLCKDIATLLSIFRLFSLFVLGPLALYKNYYLIGALHIISAALLTSIHTKLMPLDSFSEGDEIHMKIKATSEQINKKCF